jgi:hypothetical protein
MQPCKVEPTGALPLLAQVVEEEADVYEEYVPFTLVMMV